MGQKQFDFDEDDDKTEDKPIDEPVKEVLSDEQIKKEVEENQRIKNEMNQFWQTQKLYYKDVQTCTARDECLLNGQLSVKNSETLGTLFEYAINLQNALKLHMLNSLRTKYRGFQKVRNLHVDYQFKATHTVFDFQFQFYTGRQNGVVLTTSMVHDFLWRGLTTRFTETYDIKPEYLKIGKFRQKPVKVCLNYFYSQPVQISLQLNIVKNFCREKFMKMLWFHTLAFDNFDFTRKNVEKFWMKNLEFCTF